MSGTRLAALLERLKRELDGLLSCLEAQTLPERSVVDAAWAGVERSFEAVRARMDELDPASPERTAARDGVEQCLRLHAVAAALLVRQRERLILERQACSLARQRVRAAKTADRRGDSCDVRG